MNAARNTLVVALLLLHVVAANGDVLYKNTNAIAVGKGKLDNNIIHWTYCDGKRGDFMKPPHRFVTGENCKIQPDAFGITEKDGQFFVQDEKTFHWFFPDAAKGDQVGFSVTSKSIRMTYRGKGLIVYRQAPTDNPAGDPK